VLTAPNPDPLISDDNHYGKVIEECTCPHCKRSVCVKCKTPWHKEMSCEKFQKLKHSNDALMLDLADRRKWKECPNCRHLIEKSQGCNHMKCRLVFHFISFPGFVFPSYKMFLSSNYG
jgi:E3 ubiquitin-protein ligase RNF144